jgi:enamine deaminase RidA (YjgF/YER057c/UK114 family)
MTRVVCRFSIVFAAALLFGALPAHAQESKLAISGFDPVAYFTDGKPVEGQPAFEHLWHNARWRFVSAAHRDLFASNPEQYAPQFDGYCAMGVMGVAVAAAHKDTVDPQAWAIVDGKLYLTHTKGSMENWRQNAGDNIKKAEVNWVFVKDQAEPVLVGPPCRADPPSVIVTTSDNKRRLIVGRQVAVDQTGQPIGKGDIGAQLRQVGKNLDACLKAVGASEDDLIFTRIYVSDKSLLANGADSQSRFLRPDGPSSTMIVGPNFAGPDFLIGVEGVANLN